MDMDADTNAKIGENQELVARLRTVLGEKGWVQDPSELEPWLIDSRQAYHGACVGMARPESATQVSEVLKIAKDAGVAVVPQGGNTSRVGGATPDETGSQLLINLGRMNKVRDIDPSNYSMTVEAGCVLKNVQDAAIASDRLFPLSLGAEGSCMIGGNLASNAGGINVLRYGNARDLVLGLEVVLPDGRIWNGLRGLRKDNTGYDLKQIFLGSEGTLGIITAAVLKLFPLPKARATALVALRDLEAAVDLLAMAREASGDALSSFELMPGMALDWADRYIDGAKRPFQDLPEWTVLMEFSATRADAPIVDAMEVVLGDAFENETISDAVIAQSDGQRQDLWFLREAIVDAQGHEGAQIKHDIAVPVSRVPELIRRANEAVIAKYPGTRPYPFGHVGDGNIHYNLSQPRGADPAPFLAARAELNRVVHDVTVSLGGTISAEHGIGISKRDELAHYKDPMELEMMRSLKAHFDPHGMMNPGKVL